MANTKVPPIPQQTQIKWKNKKRAILRKQKLLVYIHKAQSYKMSLHELTPKNIFQALLQLQNSPIGPKKLKMIPKYKKMEKSEN